MAFVFKIDFSVRFFIYQLFPNEVSFTFLVVKIGVQIIGKKEYFQYNEHDKEFDKYY